MWHGQSHESSITFTTIHALYCSCFGTKNVLDELNTGSPDIGIVIFDVTSFFTFSPEIHNVMLHQTSKRSAQQDSSKQNNTHNTHK